MAQEPAAPERQTRETYNTVAETVGFVPSLRLKDNVIQGIAVVVITGIAALVGLLTAGTSGLVVATVFGLIGSLLFSGAVLMVVGWVRVARKISK